MDFKIKVTFVLSIVIFAASPASALDLDVPDGIAPPGTRDVVLQATQTPVRYYADTDTDTRERQCLNGPWKMQIVPRSEFTLKDYPDNEKMPVWIKPNERPKPDKPWKTILVPSQLSRHAKFHKAWLKREFSVAKSMKTAERIVLRFGAFGGWGRVFVNGTDVGYAFAEATPFEVDITKFVKRQGTNELLVCVTASWTKYGGSILKRHIITQDHWWWSTMGLWKDNWLIARPAVRTDNVYIRTSTRKKTLAVTIRLANDSDTAVSAKVSSVVLESGKPVLSLPEAKVKLSAGQVLEIEKSVSWKNPRLWCPKDPHLYILETTIKKDGRVVDVHRERFGFREIWRQGKHLMFNGHKLFIRQRSICYQSSLDGYRAQIRDVKAEGRNLVRITGIQDPNFFHLADEEGMLVKEQIGWHHPGSVRLAPDYEENTKPVVRSWIERDRNHPSIVLWCATNEPYCADYLFVRHCLYGMMQKWINQYDSTRPVDHEGIGQSVLNTKSKRNEFVKANFDIYNDHYPAPTRPIADLETYPENWHKHENIPLIFGEWYPGGPGRDGASILGNTHFENLWSYYFHHGAIAAWPSWKAMLERVVPHWRGYQITGDDLWSHFHVPANHFIYAPRDKVRVQWNWTGLGMKPLTLSNDNLGYLHSIIDTDSDYHQTMRRLYAPLWVGWESNDHLPTGGKTWPKTLLFSNESFADAEAEVTWRLISENGVSWPADEGKLTVKVPEGTVLREKIAIRLPKTNKRAEYKLILLVRSHLKTGFASPVSVTVFPASIVQAKMDRKVVLYDPSGSTKSALGRIGVKVRTVSAPDARLTDPAKTLLVIGENALDDKVFSAASKLIKFVSGGGHILQLAQTKWKYWLPAVTKLESYPASYSFIQAARHPIFAGLRQSDLSNWDGRRGQVCSHVLLKPEKGLWKNLTDAGEAMQTSLLAEIPQGKGSILLCQYDLCPRAASQPVPGRLLANILSYAGRKPQAPKKVAFLASKEQLTRWKDNMGLVAEVTGWADLEKCTAAVVAPDKKLTAKEAARLEAFAAKGATVLLIARNPEAIAGISNWPKIEQYMPDPRPTSRKKEFVRLYEGVSSGPMGMVLKTDFDLLDGVNNADLYWRTIGQWGWKGKDTNALSDYTIGCNATWQPVTLPYVMAQRKIAKGRIVITTLKDADGKGNWTVKMSRIWGNVFSNLGAKLVDDESSKLQKGGFTRINLSAYVNAALKDDAANDAKGGWSDQGNNDLRHFPAGRQTFNSVPFSIADPKRNKGKAAISVASKHVRIPYPKAVKGIELGNKRYSRLYFLHTAAWGGAGKLATYRIRYEKIYEIVHDIPIVGGERMNDWWSVKDGKKCKVAWKGSGGVMDSVGVYITVWENPYPKAPLEYLDIISENQGSLFLLGVTGQE